MGKGKFSGFPWHLEYHSGKTRKYQETCIYLNDERECENPKSYHYLSKCFISSTCNLKRKDSLGINTIKQKTNNKLLKEMNIVVTIKDCVTLVCVEDKSKIELYMNNLTYEKLAELHKQCINKKIGDIVRHDDFTYKILKIDQNVTSKQSFIILTK